MGQTFQSYHELEQFVQKYQSINFIQLYIKTNSESIAAAEKRRTGNTKNKEEIKFTEYLFPVFTEAKNSKQVRQEKLRPNTLFLKNKGRCQ